MPKVCTLVLFILIMISKHSVHNEYFIIILNLLKILIIIESVDSLSRDERDVPLTQYITNAGIFCARYTITHFKHHHRLLRSNECII